MNKLNQLLVPVLLVAVIWLMYRDFSRPSASQAEPPVIKLPAKKDAGKGTKIAFINADSLLKQYNYFTETKSVYEAKAERAEKSLEEKARKIEAEYMMYQQKAQTMTQDQLRNAEQSLMMKQQDLAKEKEKLTKQLIEEEDRLNKELREKVNAYMKKLSEKNGFDYVLSYQKGSTLIYGDPAFDITTEVINDLNKQYNEEKKEKKK